MISSLCTGELGNAEFLVTEERSALFHDIYFSMLLVTLANVTTTRILPRITHRNKFIAEPILLLSTVLQMEIICQHFL